MAQKTAIQMAIAETSAEIERLDALEAETDLEEIQILTRRNTLLQQSIMLEKLLEVEKEQICMAHKHGFGDIESSFDYYTNTYEKP